MKTILFIMLSAILGFSFQSFAQGDLLITPKRVVFEGNKQTESLNLANTGKDTAIYSISFIQYNMKEDGSFEIIQQPDPGQMFADPYLRVFPRVVTLAPDESQLIMLQCRRNTDMLAGEYRSHLYFRSEENYKPLGTKKTASDSTLLSVQLIPVFGLSIPIIIRSGAVNLSATLSDLKLETLQDDTQILKLTINRKGNISIYGDIVIQYIPTQGKPYQIGEVMGVGIYTNINKRKIDIKLNNNLDKKLKTGKLKVQYLSNGNAKPIVYAEGETEIK